MGRSGFNHRGEFAVEELIYWALIVVPAGLALYAVEFGVWGQIQ